MLSSFLSKSCIRTIKSVRKPSLYFYGSISQPLVGPLSRKIKYEKVYSNFELKVQATRDTVSRSPLALQFRTFHHSPSSHMFIQTENTPNPESIKFIPDRTVLEEEFGSGMYFKAGEKDLARSPLAKKLLQIPGVVSVFFGRDFITITKRVDEVWPLIKPEVFATIMDYYAEGLPIVRAEPEITGMYFFFVFGENK